MSSQFALDWLRKVLQLWFHSEDATEIALVILKSSRPPGWCFGPLLYGIGALNSQVLPRTRVTLLLSTLQVLSLSLPLCIIVFGINDVYDYHSDSVNPRKVLDGLEGTVLPLNRHQDVRMAAYLSTAFIIGTAALRNLTVLFSTTLLVVFSWQYSSPPLRLKEIPLVDSLSNGAIVYLSWLIGFHSNGIQLHKNSKGYILGVCTAGVHALGAVVDAKPDAAAGQTTIATTFGPGFATAFSLLTFLTALCLEGLKSIFGVYLAGGTLSMLVALVQPEGAHVVFQLVVYWTIGMSAVWFSSRIVTRIHR